VKTMVSNSQEMMRLKSQNMKDQLRLYSNAVNAMNEMKGAIGELEKAIYIR
jgi:hypothetical protein